jgi:hypothetical protein
MYGPTPFKEPPMKRLLLALGLLVTSLTALGADMSNGADNFYTSDKVTVEKVTFNNQYAFFKNNLK